MASKPKVLVCQPFITEGAPLDFRVLGIQRWLSVQISNAGFDVATSLFSDPRSPGVRRLLLVGPPTEEELHESLTKTGSSFGVLTWFDIVPRSGGLDTRLVRARLVRLRNGALELVPDLTFEGDAHGLAFAAHDLTQRVLEKLDVERDERAWHEAFGTTETSAASNYLGALGIHAVCDQGMKSDMAEGGLRALLAAIRSGVEPAIDLLPHFVSSLKKSGSATEEALVAAAREAMKLVEPTPASWTPMLRELGMMPRSALN